MSGEYEDELEKRRQFVGNGTIMCGVCGQALRDHGPPPCPHAIDRITIANRKRSEQVRRRTV